LLAIDDEILVLGKKTDLAGVDWLSISAEGPEAKKRLVTFFFLDHHDSTKRIAFKQCIKKLDHFFLILYQSTLNDGKDKFFFIDFCNKIGNAVRFPDGHWIIV